MEDYHKQDKLKPTMPSWVMIVASEGSCSKDKRGNWEIEFVVAVAVAVVSLKEKINY
jgi:hypothetical protein